MVALTRNSSRSGVLRRLFESQFADGTWTGPSRSSWRRRGGLIDVFKFDLDLTEGRTKAVQYAYFLRILSYTKPYTKEVIKSRRSCCSESYLTLSTPSSSATPSMRNREEEPEASGRAGRRNGRASPGREVRGPAQTRGTHEIGQSILYDLRQNLFNRVKGCPSRSLTTAGRKILSRITNDVNHIRSWPPR